MPLEGMKVNGVRVPVAVDPAPAPAPAAWFAPEYVSMEIKLALANLVFAQIPGSTWQENATEQVTYWFVPCESTATISVIIGGWDYVIPAREWVAGPVDNTGNCQTRIISSWNQQINVNIVLGMPFASTVYSVLKFGPGPQLGFAPLSDAALRLTSEGAENAGARPSGAIPGAGGNNTGSGTGSGGAGPSGSTGNTTAPPTSDATHSRLSWLAVAGALAVYLL
jgi:hypothetical protein